MFVQKWAAISLALVGPAAQEAIPVLLQSVSSKEKDVAQAINSIIEHQQLQQQTEVSGIGIPAVLWPLMLMVSC